AAGDFRFEIATAGAVTLVLQTVLVPLATAAQPSRVEVTGGTHVPASPSFHYLASHWRAVIERLGLAVTPTLVKAGFYPPGGGGKVTTTEVTRHLETVAGVVSQFGIKARTWGRRGGPGGLEVERV